MDKFLITKRSYNPKTGPIMVTTSPRSSCPLSCPLRSRAEGDLAGGCYAEHGFIAAYMWANLARLPVGATYKKGQIKIHSFDELLSAIREQPEGGLWRHNQAGDLPSDDGVTLNREKLRKIVKANRGRRGFTYTHFDVAENLANRKAVREANEHGFTINLSADSAKQADKLADLKIGPVVTVLPKNQLANTKTPKGRPITICPAVLHKAVTCKTCGICATQRKAIIGFPAIGFGRDKIKK